MAATGLGPLPRKRGSTLAQGCDRGGRVVLPLARAAGVSIGLRVLLDGGEECDGRAPGVVGELHEWSRLAHRLGLGLGLGL